jgi:transposase
MPKRLRITFDILPERLCEMEKREKSAVVRSRLMLVRLVLGGMTPTQAAGVVGLCETQAYAWVRRFNAAGPEGLRNLPKRPRQSRLKRELVEAFKQRVANGATPADGVSVLRGKDFRRILQDEFSAACSLGGTYYILHKLDFSNLSPRPQHPECDPAAQAEFKKTSRSA